MSIYRPRTSDVWVADFHFCGQRVRFSTGTKSKTLALKIEGKRRRDLEAGAAGIGKQQGPLLLTHWGFSGPAALKLSAWAARELHDVDYKATLLVNWTASENQEVLYQSFLQRKKQHPYLPLPPLLPSKLFQRLLAAVDIDPQTPLAELSNKALAQLAAKLQADPYIIEGKTTYKQEFVTAGGVNLKEIDFKTMESRIAPGLFFAGEILNIDGVTGGFNFQNAWTTGWLAGTAMAQYWYSGLSARQ